MLSGIRLMINEALEQYLAKKQQERKNKTSSGKFKPSLFGYCFLRQYWERLREEPSNPPDMKTVKTFLLGDLIHEFLEGLFPASQRECEMVSEDEHGFADIVTDDAVWDIKSSSGSSFKYLKPRKDETRADHNERILKDKWHNVLQVTRYGVYFKKPYCGLCFVNKENFEIEEAIWETKEFEGWVDAELAQLRACWNEQEPPPPQPRLFNGKECSYCAYENKCKGKPF